MLTEDQLKEFEIDFNSGLKIKQLKAKYSIGSNGLFYKILDKLNLQNRNTEKTNNLPTKEEFYNFYIEQNNSLKSTKKYFNISTTTFYKLCDLYNIYKDDKLKIEATKSTMIKRYGVDNSRKIKEVNDKIKQTNLEKYGSISPLGNKDIRSKIEKHFNDTYGGYPLANKDVQEKIKQTNLKNYGVDNISKSHYNILALKVLKDKDSFREYILSIPKEDRTILKIAANLKVHPTNISHRIHKHDLTHLINYFPTGSFMEDQAFEKLIKIFPHTLRQYDKDSRYPFRCDFYIPSLDLFIECQYSPHHGEEPFDSNNEEHLLKIKNLELDNTDWSDRSIFIWTKRDPLKREIARKNNLNYLEFFNEEEFNQWINTF